MIYDLPNTDIQITISKKRIRSLTMNGGFVSGNHSNASTAYGAGVNNNGTFIMAGGSIGGNAKFENGSDNLEQIQAFLVANDVADDTGTAENYPAAR